MDITLSTKASCVRTIVVWKLIDNGIAYFVVPCCVRTIVVWKHVMMDRLKRGEADGCVRTIVVWKPFESSMSRQKIASLVA